MLQPKHAKTTPSPFTIVWRTVWTAADDTAADWPGPWPVFLDLTSSRVYTVDDTGEALVKHGEELLQRFVPDSMTTNDGRVITPGAPTVLARTILDAGGDAARGWIATGRCDRTLASVRAALPQHWKEFERHSGLAVGPGCIVWTQPRGAGFRPQTPFSHIAGAPPHLVLGCRFGSVSV